MGNQLRAADVRHRCDIPSPDHPVYGSRNETFARWRCHECGQRWALEAEFLDHGRFLWNRKGAARWRWIRAERKRREAEWR